MHDDACQVRFPGSQVPCRPAAKQDSALSKQLLIFSIAVSTCLEAWGIWRVCAYLPTDCPYSTMSCGFFP